MPHKWLDNILSHYDIDGVSRSRQGVSRKLNARAVLIIDIALRLSRTLSIPIAKAIDLASDIAGRHDTRAVVSGGISLHVDIDGIRAELDKKLAEAVEVAPLPKRGRPRRNP